MAQVLKELLTEDNFGLQRDIQGEVWSTLAWTHCLEYEYQLRKEAPRPCFEEGFSIQEALWSAYADPQHRTKHWIQLLAKANSRSSSSNAEQQKVATLERKVAELERKNRSGPPPQRAIKGTGKSKKNKRAPLAIQNVAAAQTSGGKGKAVNGKGNKGKADRGKGNKGTSSAQAPASAGALQRLHSRNQNILSFCCNFQSRRCQDANCLRFHACAGCNTANVPYADCRCLATA